MRLPFIYLAVFLAVLVMSTASILIKYSAAPALIIAFYRVLFTTLLAGAISGFRKPDLTGISRRSFIMLIASGLFLALHFAFWISSLNYTSISSSVLFTNLQVIFVLIFSVLFLQEKLSGTVVAGIFLALIGSFFIARGDLHSGKLPGDMLALASGFFIAVYFLIGRRLRPYIDTMSYTFMVSLTATVVLLPICAAAGLSWGGYRWVDWGIFILLALGPGLAGHGILNWALKYVKAPIVAVSILGESVGATILAWFIFQELLQWYQVTGGLLILIGIYMAAAHENKESQEAYLHPD